MARKKATQFIVIPPAEKQIFGERIISALLDRFPGFGFTIVGGGKEPDEFAVFPVVGTVGEGEAAGMCEHPPRGLLEEMKKFCEDVDLSTPQRVL